MSESCQTCRFWDVYDEAGALHQGRIGDCRRRAPSISDELLRRALPGPGADQFEEVENNLYIPSAFPVTHVESWCGEYEARRAVA